MKKYTVVSERGNVFYPEDDFTDEIDFDDFNSVVQHIKNKYTEFSRFYFRTDRYGVWRNGESWQIVYVVDNESAHIYAMLTDEKDRLYGAGN